MLIISLCTPSSAQVINLNQVKNTQVQALDQVLSDYAMLALDTKKLKSINSSLSQENISLAIGQNQLLNLEVAENQLIGSTTGVRLLSESAEIKATADGIKTYHGTVVGQPNSSVAITVADDYFYASIRSNKKHYVIEPVHTYDKSASTEDYVFYEVHSLLEDNKYTCKRHNLLSEIQEQVSSAKTNSLACVDLELALAVDYMMFVNYGSSIQNVLNYLATIYNLVGLDYDNEFNDQINLRIKEVVVATCLTCDPWTKTNNVGNALESIRSWGENGGFNETYDVAVYWTTRVYDDNFAGLAYQDQVCGDQRYIAVRQYTTNNQAIRIMMSHEIGHSLGCGHNFEIGGACDGNAGRPPKIMDPIVDPSSVGWTNGTQSCDQNSTAVINNKLLTNACLGACQTITCNSVTNLTINNVSTSGISASWNGTAGSYRVRVKEEGSNSYFYNTVISNTSVTINAPLDYCKQYHVSVRSVCTGGADPAAITALTEIPGGTAIDILYAEPKNCDAGTYDLEVVVAYNNTVPGGFMLNANGTSQVFSYTSSPQTVTIVGINSSNNNNALLQAIGTNNNDPACIGNTTYVEPSNDCEISICESFNSCVLPFGWIASSTNSSVFSENFEWKFADGARNILNYGAAQNASTNKTINGTCAAYFDDDIFMNAGYTGTITLESRAYDLSNMTDVSISVDYNFHNFIEGKMNSNQSEFSIDVFNGSSWVGLMFDDNDVCPWYNVWPSNCTTNFTLNVSNYISSQFKVRFVYTDGNTGDWTGMIMLDDFKVIGTQLPVLDLSIINFEGVLDADKAILAWDVEIDNSFSHYVLERSLDGVTFEKLASIDDDIRYTDNQPVVGYNYYRLKVYDQDGHAIDSDIIMIDYTPANAISLYPNPVTNDKVTLVNGTQDQFEYIDLYTLKGEKLDQIPTLGRSTIDLDISDLDQGVYLLQLRSSTTSKTLRLVRI